MSLTNLCRQTSTNLCDLSSSNVKLRVLLSWSHRLKILLIWIFSVSCANFRLASRCWILSALLRLVEPYVAILRGSQRYSPMNCSGKVKCPLRIRKMPGAALDTLRRTLRTHTAAMRYGQCFRSILGRRTPQEIWTLRRRHLRHSKSAHNRLFLQFRLWYN